ncbi:hypothetical protein [Streptomyces sp. NPDC060001]|uniref:hypothetical protein n=1 Tax=Streptomyces sp. NPDC060001 TaxID=3347032 RepID=UPI0036C4C8E7
MTTSPISPAQSSLPDGGDTAVDLTLAGRAVSSGPWIAGLILAAELDTVGTPRKLARDLFPGTDPAVVQEIWDRALAVGVRAGQLMAAPRFNRDKLARLQGELVEAGHAAMGGMVAVPVRQAEWMPGGGLEADGESAREH